MIFCPLTRHLWRFDRSMVNEILAAHLRRCDSCKIAWNLTRPSRAIQNTAEDCPSGDAFGDLAVNRMSVEKIIHLTIHARKCSACTKKLQMVGELVSGTTETPDLSGLVTKAERVLDAQVLAKELSDWLSTEVFPREADAVAARFDSDYASATEALQESGSRVKSCEPELMGLGFAGSSGLSLSQRIVWLAAFGAHLYTTELESPSELAQALSRWHVKLQQSGFSVRLLDSAIDWLQSPDRDSD